MQFGQRSKHNGNTHVKEKEVEEPETEWNRECGAEERQEPGGGVDGRVYADRLEVHVQRRQLLLRAGTSKRNRESTLQAEAPCIMNKQHQKSRNANIINPEAHFLNQLWNDTSE